MLHHPKRPLQLQDKLVVGLAAGKQSTSTLLLINHLPVPGLTAYAALPLHATEAASVDSCTPSKASQQTVDRRARPKVGSRGPCL